MNLKKSATEVMLAMYSQIILKNKQSLVEIFANAMLHTVHS